MSAGGSVEPFFFGKAGRRRFGVLHTPARPLERPRVLVLCHPHFEEKLWAHRVLLDLAERACAAGFSVLRFDLSGHGDSDGDFEDFGFTDLEEDVADAVEVASQRSSSEPVLFGLRLGGTLAGRRAARVGIPVVLWEPVVEVDAWLQETLRANLTFQIRRFGKVRRNRAQLAEDLAGGAEVMIEGYGLTRKFWREARESGGLSGPAFPGASPESLLLRFRRPGRPSATAGTEDGPFAGAETIRVVDVEEEPFWTDVRRYRTASPAATGPTLRWLAGLAGRAS